MAPGAPNKVFLNGGDITMNVVANEWTATGLLAQAGGKLEGTANLDVLVKAKTSSTSICVAPAWDATNAKATALHVEGQGRKVHPHNERI